MCGIVGYIGPREAAPILLEGLARLEYRGYDSAGIALVTADGELFVEKRAGKLAVLRTALADQTPSAAIGLAHTRWATHGRPNDLNAHPHVDCTGDITVIHNGIIENFRALRDGLAARGHTLRSETDTEALAHLVEEAYRGDLAAAVREALAQAQGAYAVAVMHRGEPSRLVGARMNVPLIVGLGDGEAFLASDVAAVLAHTRRVIFLEEGDVADLTADGVVITAIDGTPRERAVHTIDWDIEAAEKGGYPHFMLKEMHEQPQAIRSAIAGRIQDDGIVLDELIPLADRLREIERVELVACGSAHYAASVGAYLLQAWTGLPGPQHGRLGVPLQPAAARRQDAGHRRDPVGRDGRHDRARALRARAGRAGHRHHQHDRLGHHARRRRRALPAGRAGDRGRGHQDVRDPGHDPRPARGRPGQGAADAWRPAPSVSWWRRCASCPTRPSGRSTWPRRRAAMARRYVNSRGFMFVGRGVGFPVALEGALKLKEVSYVHAEGYAAGELKHGPISLLDIEVPLVAVATRSALQDKLISNVMEGRARDARVLAVATEGDEAVTSFADDILWVPETLEALSPILAVIPLQLFAYHTAVARGTDVDQPRNLAKSVTVE